ncbi:MAG: radical SAM protein [Candidatus Lokiarchaeota archaeon]|nr:radical SAM protein [Candidatus Lokiarchaeota archaeon]
MCKDNSKIISKNLGVCYDCIINERSEAISRANNLHKRCRQKYNLPVFPPEEKNGVACNWCQNNCKVLEQKSYCGLMKNIDGKKERFAGINKGLASWYYDPLPTNCVADWVCPAGSSCGYPTYSTNEGPEYGYKNLAVFYGSCTFDCLFCQNSQYKDYLLNKSPIIKKEDLAAKVRDDVSCICYFGGDPSSQVIHSILTSQIALKKAQKKNKILCICWETNGSTNEKIMNKMASIALKSGGCIKFDLKTYSEKLNIALCGVSNKQTIKNFRNLSSLIDERPEVPLLVASTLLVPGYVDVKEVDKVSKFIADLNPEIPYRLLGFYPHYLMNDLPRTSLKHAKRCKIIAKKNGLKNISIGNTNLLLNKEYQDA